MSLYESTAELVGNTPLVKLTHVEVPEGVSLYAKLELANPSGSVKDRTGRYMIRELEKSGKLKKGGTVILATAGNTGLGVAFSLLNTGYKLLVVVPTKFSQEKQTLMRALGATIINTPREGGMLGAQAKAEELLATVPDSVTINQFSDLSNPLAHYETTGPEIYRDLDGKIDYFIAGAGSGGTYSGIMRYLKEKDPKIVGVLADPIGSTMGGGEHGDYDIEGIGNDFIAATMDMNLVDQVIKVSDTEAFANSRLLALKEGIFAGSSSGAALASAIKLAHMPGVKGNIVTVFPDRGDRYFTKNLYE
ncbi:MAG: cysteine synthase family protein [Lachnospiraceae bacterium]|nr:cysteine synthase family protein [Lachnospiraceae bacterium]